MKQSQKNLDQLIKQGYLYLNYPFSFNLKKTFEYCTNKKIPLYIIRKYSKKEFYTLELNLTFCNKAFNIIYLNTLIESYELNSKIKLVYIFDNDKNEYIMYSDNINKNYLYNRMLLFYSDINSVISFMQLIKGNEQLYFYDLTKINNELGE